MGMGLNFGLGLGSAQQADPYIDLTLPQSDNIVRAWSMRRVIPAYANGNALKEIREEGGAETNVPFLNNGNISMAGASAFAAVLYDQKGADASKLRQTTFADCPKVHDTVAGTYLFPQFDVSDNLQMAGIDTTLESAFAAIATTGFTVSLWVRSSVIGSTYSYYISRRSETGHMRVYRAGGELRMRIRGNDIIVVAPSLSANTWYHIAITAKGANGESGLKIYLDAVEPSAIPIPAASEGTNNLQIGNVTGSTTTGVDNVNDVIVWDKELTAPEVTTLFNAQCGYYGVSAK